MNIELKQIRNIYGEEMMHLCRDLFPSLLETQGLLLSILQKGLAPSRSFASDIKEHYLYEEFKDWIYSFIDVEENDQVITTKTPFELMDDAGYILIECKSEDDIQSFGKYYESNEVLCTIYNGGRLNRCYVFFAVKKNVDEIKREFFSNPQRQDEYGTSVISIQFARDNKHTISIKNRYNHTVNNPDATFSNNLENIIPGLTSSFEKYLGFKINQNETEQAEFLTNNLPYIRAQDGKYYRYNLEVDGIYYCENNIIIQEGQVITEYANYPERYILLDQYVFDLKEKKIALYEYDFEDAFMESINSVGKIARVEVLKNKENGTKSIIIYYEDNKQVKILINKANAIIGYENEHVVDIGKGFLEYNRQLSNIALPQVQTIGDYFLENNKRLLSITLPQVQTIGSEFLCRNWQLNSITLPQVQTIGDYFLEGNMQLSSITLPRVQTIGYEFLCDNRQLSRISLPQVQDVGFAFLYHNMYLSSITLPQIQTIGDYFLYDNKQLNSISLPQVQTIGFAFLHNNHLIDKRKIIKEMEKRNAEINNSRSK